MPCSHREAVHATQPNAIDLSQLEYNKSKCPIEEGICGLCREILGVEKKIGDAVKQLEDLLSRHQQLKTEINRTHSPIIRDLPVEVLSRIFFLCFSDRVGGKYWEPGYTDVSVQLEIGAVCRSWRQVAWSSPELWTGIVLGRRFTSSFHVCNQYGILKEWIKRSGALPLKVSISENPLDDDEDVDMDDYSVKRNEDGCDCWEMSLLLLGQSSNRWMDVSMTLSRYSFEYMASNFKLNPPSRSLSLTSASDRGWRPPSKGHDILKLWQESTYGPKHVTTYYLVQFRDFSINWQHVRRVYVEGWTVQDCLDLLKVAPQLESSSFNNVSEYAQEPDLIPGEPITCHNSLRRLSFYSSDYAAKFFDHILLPSLDSLVYPVEDGLYSPIEVDDLSLMHFFIRSSFPLTELSVAAHMFTFGGMVGILKLVPSLTCLNVYCAEKIALIDDTRMLMRFFFDKLASTVTLTTAEGSFLPRLETLELQGAWESNFFWSSVANIFGRPSEVGMEGRRPSKFLMLHSHTPSPVKGLSDELVARFISLKEAGVSINYVVRPGWDDEIIPVTWE
ncbi:hypothetical protein D9613_004510 [Agrocybe pediades]|uniref:F-box domain-containing protein n=1 Tax=Agrocybe pediades TaxID=84607 RepID=A0A8H4QIN0_9AGAR|nr:hypothetical protein D9613_004510 [Agrocybe pediades]